MFAGCVDDECGGKRSYIVAQQLRCVLFGAVNGGPWDVFSGHAPTVFFGVAAYLVDVEAAVVVLLVDFAEQKL